MVSFFLLCHSVSTAQNYFVDSLKKQLEDAHLADTSRIQLLIKVGDNIVMNDPSGAMEDYTKAFTIAQQIENNYLKGMAMSGLGLVYDYQNNDDSAMYFYHKADSFYAADSSVSAKESRATNKASMANIERGRNHFDTAILIFLDATSIMEKSDANNKWQVLGIIYSDIATVYHDMNQFDKALAYDTKGLAAHKKQKENDQFTAYTELFVAQDFINLNNADSARKHLVAAEESARKLNSADLFYQLYSDWGGFYRKENLYKKALASYQKALPFAIQTGRKFREMDCNRMMGFIYNDLKDYHKSIEHLQKALVLVREIQNKNLEAGILKHLAEAENALGNYKKSASDYAGYIQLNDSLKEQESKRKINEIENKYQAQKKQKAIIALQKDNLLQSVELKQKRTLNIALATGFVLLLLTGALFYKNFKNKNTVLLQKEKLQQQQISELEKERKLIAAQSLMEGQEEERTRLARDLHDGVGGLLSGVKLSMSNMKGNVFLSESNVESFNNVIQQLDQSIAELRRVSHNMMPESLVKYGLKESLENYCESLNHSGKIKVQLQTYGMEERMEQGTEIVIYRMIQELLNNVIKHADAKNVLIQLLREKDRFNLTVEDDGKGFDLALVNNKATAGLTNIKARAAYLDGTVDIISAPGEGTSVNIEGDCSISS
jgi:signal transduction histidine kinase